MRNQIKKSVTKVVGVIMLIAVLFSSVGQEAQAAKQIKWPYGTYTATVKKKGKTMIDWQYASDPTVKYPESISIWFPNSSSTSATTFEEAERIQFKKKGTNKYESKVHIMRGYSFYYEIKVSKKSLKIKENCDTKSIARFFPGNKWYTFKLKKRMSKNVG